MVVKMNKKLIIVAVIIIAVIAVVGYYFMFNGGDGSSSSINPAAKQKTILLSKSAYMEVPDTKNATDKVNKNGVFYYKNKQDDINITSASNLSASASTNEMKKLKDSIVQGSKRLVENNVIIYENNGTYSVFVKNTQYNDTLLIQSSNKDLLLQCWESVKYHDPAQKIEVNDTGSSSSGSVIDVAQKTETVVSQSTSSSDTSSSSTPSTSASSWGYDWSSGSSSSSGSSGGGSDRAGGSASSSSRFDFS